MATTSFSLVPLVLRRGSVPLPTFFCVGGEFSPQVDFDHATLHPQNLVSLFTRAFGPSFSPEALANACFCYPWTMSGHFSFFWPATFSDLSPSEFDGPGGSFPPTLCALALGHA